MNKEAEYKQLLQLIKNSKTAAIVGHVRPDGDSIGSSVAMRRALLGLGFTAVDLFVDCVVPEIFSYMADVSRFNKPSIKKNEKYDLLLIVDCSDISRIGKCADLLKRAKQVAVIDHHLDTSIDADVVIADKSYASTGEIVFDFFEKNKIKMNKEIATALYTAVSSDTGCFLYANTTSQTHYIAAELLKYEIDLELINYLNFRVIDPKNFGGLVYVLKNCRFLYHDKISVLSFPYRVVSKFDIDEQMRHRLQRFASDVKGVRINVLLREGEKRGEFFISLRSHGSVNVATIAASLGGGGHRNAAGVTLTGKESAVTKKVTDAVIEYLRTYEASER
jgi:phosphoesterase RecJ-like protein